MDTSGFDSIYLVVCAETVDRVLKEHPSTLKTHLRLPWNETDIRKVTYPCLDPDEMWSSDDIRLFKKRLSTLSERGFKLISPQILTMTEEFMNNQEECETVKEELGNVKWRVTELEAFITVATQIAQIAKYAGDDMNISNIASIGISSLLSFGLLTWLIITSRVLHCAMRKLEYILSSYLIPAGP